MEITLKDITVRELAEGYKDNGEKGVRGYNGLLNIRPPYQREFIYKKKQRNEVINSINKGFPLNTMYWAVCDDGTFEIIDGQQRTVSICQYVTGEFSLDGMYFGNLTNTEQNKILDYKLSIYICKGTDKEKLDWFNIINIAGVKLTDQELRNAVYSGPWVSDAKRYFSRSKCAAMTKGEGYIEGEPLRQDILEKVINWMALNDPSCQSAKDPIREYMAIHQHDKDASAMYSVYLQIIAWAKSLFPETNKYTKKVNWGALYWKYHDNIYSPTALKEEVNRLIYEDEDVTNDVGVYTYVFTHDEKELNIRQFSPQMKLKAYKKQDGICPICHKHFEFNEMEGDHIVPWSEGGHTSQENLQMLCKNCNRRKGAK